MVEESSRQDAKDVESRLSSELGEQVRYVKPRRARCNVDHARNVVGVAAEQNPEKSKYWLANALTPFVGDVGARTPEFKAFLVNIEKID